MLLAFKRASKGKRSKPSVAAFEYDLEPNLFQLQDELQTGTYDTGPYASFYIHEGKHRMISAAPFRDRVVQHAFRKTAVLKNASGDSVSTFKIESGRKFTEP